MYSVHCVIYSSCVLLLFNAILLDGPSINNIKLMQRAQCRLSMGWNTQGFSTRIWVFSHESILEIAMTNCNCDIQITKCTHERRFQRVLEQLSVLEQGEEANMARLAVFFWHADCYNFIWDRISIRKCTVYRRKWLEGHVAPPPPPPPPESQFRGQGIHSYSDFAAWFERCISGKHLWTTIIWIAQFKLAFVLLICVHVGQNTIIRIMVTQMIILIAHFSLVWKPCN